MSLFARAKRAPRRGRLPEVVLSDEEMDRRLGVTVRGDPACVHDFDVVDVQKGCRCMQCLVFECSKCGRRTEP